MLELKKKGIININIMHAFIKLLKFLGLFIIVIIGYILLTISPIHFFNFKKVNSKPHIIIGHRGAGALGPENTIAAIRIGLANNVDRIEVDVHQTKDGEIVVIHDETLNRTTNGEGLIKSKTWDEIFKLDAGSKFSSEYKNERVPLLDEVIKFIDGRAGLIIEIKGGSECYPGIEQKIADIINDNNALEWCMVHSFYTGVLVKLHQIEPALKLHKLFIVKFSFLPFMVALEGIEYFNLEKYPYINEYSLNYHFANRRIIKKLQKSGKKVNVWTVNESKDAKKLLSIGVDGIITDFPDKMK